MNGMFPGATHLNCYMTVDGYWVRQGGGTVVTIDAMGSQRAIAEKNGGAARWIADLSLIEKAADCALRHIFL
jgi:hypothetical protein